MKRAATKEDKRITNFKRDIAKLRAALVLAQASAKKLPTKGCAYWAGKCEEYLNAMEQDLSEVDDKKNGYLLFVETPPMEEKTEKSSCTS